MPEKKYDGSIWTKVQAKKDEPLMPGTHYVLNEKALIKRKGILMFPTGSVLWKDDIPDWYNTFRHSYILVQRSVRVVPCVVGPVPNNRTTKQRRALILSVYLRPWTWSIKLADADVKHLTALDLAPSMASNSWKKYLTHVFPHSFNTIRNFLGCCMAEGKNDATNDSDDEKDDRAIPFQWTVRDVESALNHIRIYHHHHHCFSSPVFNQFEILRFHFFVRMDLLQSFWVRQFAFLFTFDFLITIHLLLHVVKYKYSTIWI